MTVAYRHAPGTLQTTLAEELGLVHKEVTLVMTDVQASSKLWEWSVSFPCCMMSAVCIPGLCFMDMLTIVSHALYFYFTHCCCCCCCYYYDYYCYYYHRYFTHTFVS